MAGTAAAAKTTDNATNTFFESLIASHSFLFRYVTE